MAFDKHIFKNDIILSQSSKYNMNIMIKHIYPENFSIYGKFSKKLGIIRYANKVTNEVTFTNTLISKSVFFKSKKMFQETLLL